MRVLQLTDFYPPQVGGVEQHVRLLSRALAQRGHHVTVATVAAGGRAADREVDGEVAVRRLTSTLGRVPAAHVEASRPFAPPAPDPELVLGIAGVLRDTRPDIVHAHGWIAQSYLPLASATRARFVVTAHEYGLACPRKDLRYHGVEDCSGPGLAKCLGCAAQHYGPVRGTPITLGTLALGPVERRAADRLIAVSRAVVEGNRLEGLPVDVIPNFLPAVDGPAGAGDGAADGAAGDAGAARDVDLERRLWQLPAEPFLLYVGALGAHKGFPVLLDAYRRLAAPPPLVSIGHRWVDTPSALPAGVTVLEDWPNDAVRAAWRRAVLGIIPSVWREPFGIVALEAMDAGLPVVASAVGGLAEVVVDGVTGVLVPPADPAALASAIERLTGDAALRRRLGEGAAARIGAYRPEVIVPRIEAVYRKALDGDRRPAPRVASGEPARRRAA